MIYQTLYSGIPNSFDRQVRLIKIGKRYKVDSTLENISDENSNSLGKFHGKIKVGICSI
ncbi:protein of unknown function [Tepidanaerobacter acetatoxydans Re1]|uniref:Uncharacterized protein n=1 Tax=Tepidanaerobacter acetatoxydans (strain DSM 21804 / JCM 16047 / Re1) TaxID=1209989 RepID=U4QDA1_TEPAE|nr:protein of unknown function [Tepidanaerobacter acetatoxydans Re1]